MLRFVTDEDFDASIVRGLLRRLKDLDIVGVRAVGLTSAQDPVVLDYAAREERVLLTHDVNTMLGHADDRLRRGLHHAGVVKIPQELGIGRAVADLEYIAQVATPEDLRD